MAGEVLGPKREGRTKGLSAADIESLASLMRQSSADWTRESVSAVFNHHANWADDYCRKCHVFHPCPVTVVFDELVKNLRAGRPKTALQ